MKVTSQLSAFLLIICGRSAIFSQKCNSDMKATPNLKELVTGKCLEYQIKINPGAFCSNRKDCNDIWLKFKAGFANQSLCNVSSSGFEDFVHATNHDIPKDRAIFWENVYLLVHRYSNQGARLTSLEDTLTGYIADSLRFCGDTTKPEGIADGTICPSYDASDDCPMSAERAFWIQASRNFAEKAAGEMTIMLSAGEKPIYSPDSYFAAYEAPYLRQGVVTDAKIILINDKYTAKRDSCDDPSLKPLLSLLQGKGINTTCEENPRLLLFQHCSDNPNSPACSSTDVSAASKTLQEMASVLQVLVLSLSVFFMI